MSKKTVMHDIYQQLTIRLFSLEVALRDLGLWSEDEPESHRLRSTAPFACDLLSLEEWLQHIFLPRMHDIVQGRLALPDECNIEPYARECFAGREVELKGLLTALAELDALISDVD